MAHLTTAVTVGVSFLVTQTNYCVPEDSREVILSLQTTLPRADTESDWCCGSKWAGPRDYMWRIIMECGSTPYIGMALKKNGCYSAGVQSDVLKTLP